MKKLIIATSILFAFSATFAQEGKPSKKTPMSSKAPTSVGEFYFEQSNLEYSRKRAKGKLCYYDQIVSEIKSTCEYNKIMKHSSSKNGSVNFTTYKCPGAKYKGYLGFAQIDGNGVIQLFPK